MRAADYDVYPKTHVSFSNCTFTSSGNYFLIKNKSKSKVVYVETFGSIVTGEKVSANVEKGAGKIYVESDLPGLK